MSELTDALARLEAIEAAVAAGDFDAANAAAQDLRPLLVSRNVEALTALKARVEALKLGVVARQAEQSASLRKLQHKREGAAIYQALAEVR